MTFKLRTFFEVKIPSQVSRGHKFDCHRCVTKHVTKGVAWGFVTKGRDQEINSFQEGYLCKD